MGDIVKSADTRSGQRFISAVDIILSLDKDADEHSKRVAFDCEGVNLSRLGTLEIMSICFPSMEVYLIDLAGKTCPTILKSVKDLFESRTVTKIIHDCRMDCDALFHHHGIKLYNVHDTSCFHQVITHTGEKKSLNDVLLFNRIAPNAVRDNSVYKYNPAYWSTRPLTRQMVQWASSDVDKLFALADEQLSLVHDATKCSALNMSVEYTRIARKMNVCTGLRVNNPGLFIGRGGQNISSLVKRTGTLIYQDSSRRGSWYVYYHSDASLDAVKRSMSM